MTHVVYKPMYTIREQLMRGNCSHNLFRELSGYEVQDDEGAENEMYEWVVEEVQREHGIGDFEWHNEEIHYERAWKMLRRFRNLGSMGRVENWAQQCNRYVDYAFTSETILPMMQRASVTLYV